MGRGQVAAALVAAVATVSTGAQAAGPARSRGLTRRQPRTAPRPEHSIPARERVGVRGAGQLYRPPTTSEPELEPVGVTGRLPFGLLPWRVTTVEQTQTRAADAPSIVATVPGLTFADGGAVPPDVQLGVSPTAAVEMVNVAVTFWRRSGLSLQRGATTTLGSFFSTTTTNRSHDGMTDPRVVYDAATGRWFALAFDVTRSESDLGVSTTSDPTGGWIFYAFGSTGCPDYPRLAVSSDLVVITDILFTACSGGGFTTGEVTVISKQALLNGSLGANDYAFYGGSESRFFSIAPVQPVSPETGLFLVSVSPGTSTTALLYAVTGPSQSTIPFATIPISTLRSPPGAVQPGTSQTIDAGDNRVQNAFWDQGTLWFAAGDTCTSVDDPTSRGCARLEALSTATNRVVAENELALDQHRFLYYPTIVSDTSGNVLVAFSYSSAGSDFPSFGVATKLAAGGFSPWAKVAGGAGAYAILGHDGRNRWGDYFGTARDPSDGGMVWFAGEFASSATSWATTLAAVRATAPAVAVPAVSYSSPSAIGVTATGATLTGNVNPQGAAATYSFEYGTTSAYGQRTPTQSLAASSSFQAVTAAITGLTPSTTYHFLLDATNAGGTAVGIDQTFTTPAAGDTTPPRVVAITSRGARGSAAKLRYRLWEDSGSTREEVGIVNSSGRIATVRTGFGTVADGATYYVRWKVPKHVKTPLGFCVTAFDHAGNRSAESCAKLVLG